MAPSKQSCVPPISTTPDKSLATSTPARRYGRIQDSGAIRQRWLEDPTDPTCNFQPSTLTVDDLKKANWFIHTAKGKIPSQVSHNAFALGYANEEIYNQTVTHSVAKSIRVGCGCANIYGILIGNGLLVAAGIVRVDGPQFSQIARARMQDVADPQSLRHFYVSDIINSHTSYFVKNVLYSPRNGLTWPPACRDQRVWEYNTPEYQGLLGTRIGKCAVYLVLEIFPRGTFYIARIVTWDHDYSLEMRFDIEPIPISVSAD